MNPIEDLHFVPCASQLDLTGAATNPVDSINMEGQHRCTFIVQFHAIGVAAAYVKVFSGATAAAETSALTFRYAWGGAACLSANADVLTAWSTSANLTVAHATYDNFMLIIQVDASDMDVANGENWLTLTIPDTDTGLTGNATVIALTEPRYKDNMAASITV